MIGLPCFRQIQAVLVGVPDELPRQVDAPRLGRVVVSPDRGVKQPRCPPVAIQGAVEVLEGVVETDETVGGHRALNAEAVATVMGGADHWGLGEGPSVVADPQRNGGTENKRTRQKMQQQLNAVNSNVLQLMFI